MAELGPKNIDNILSVASRRYDVKPGKQAKTTLQLAIINEENRTAEEEALLADHIAADRAKKDKLAQASNRLKAVRTQFPAHPLNSTSSNQSQATAVSFLNDVPGRIDTTFHHGASQIIQTGFDENGFRGIKTTITRQKEVPPKQSFIGKGINKLFGNDDPVDKPASNTFTRKTVELDPTDSADAGSISLHYNTYED